MDPQEGFMYDWEGPREVADPAAPPPPARVEQAQASSTDDVLDPDIQLLLDFEDLLNYLESDVMNAPQETTAEIIMLPGSPFMPFESSLEEVIPFEAPGEMDSMDILDKSGQETKPVASDPNESYVCPSPKTKTVLHYQPTTNQNGAASSSVPSFIANDNPVILDGRPNHWGTFNRPELHTCAVPLTCATDNAASRKRKLDDTEDKPYIKKPPNAFMLFRTEQRQNVMEELHITNAAIVNKVLGQKWKMLSVQEQAPYFEQAHREKMAHEANYPGWSARDNFGKKVKRRKADNISVPLSHHHFAFPVAPANHQPVMMWPHTAVPMNQAQSPSYQGYYQSPVQGPQYQAVPQHAPANQALNNQAYYNQNSVQVPQYQAVPHHTPANQALNNQDPSIYNPVNQAFCNNSPVQVHPIQSISNNQPLTNKTRDDYLAPNNQGPIQELSEETFTINFQDFYNTL